jgi:hypothetical protein
MFQEVLPSALENRFQGHRNHCYWMPFCPMQERGSERPSGIREQDHPEPQIDPMMPLMAVAAD